MADNEGAIEVLCEKIETKVFISEGDLAQGHHFEPKTSEPITIPLKTLDDVLLWKPGEDEFNVATEPLAGRTSLKDHQPMTLVCHDMMGGYTDDRFVQGVSKVDCYRFYHWQYLDSFIYFSHYFVTIPPPCWTNAAHKNGVLMLGTLITEWNDGAARCAQVFQSENAFKIFADKLVAICKYYRFDGWLINIENKIKPEHMPQLVEFVKYLTKEMNEQIPGSKVIWYDSVIIDGSLKWQDMVNQNNRVFFDSSDGIFLNYTWNERKLADSVQNANDRVQDVFVGVDIFGRNCFGGGGWNTYKAMQVIRNNNLSAAIFAPGWVFEKMRHEDFIQNQNKFWEDQLHEYLHSHGVTSLPFVSNFCRGYGQFGFKFGKKAMQKFWCNPSAQQIQPTYNRLQFKEGAAQTMRHDTSDGFSGGGSLTLKGTFGGEKCQSFKIFVTCIETKSHLLVSVVTKASSNCEGFLYFELSNGKKVCLVASSDSEGEEIKTMSDFGINFSVSFSDQSLLQNFGDDVCKVFLPVSNADQKIIQEITCGMDINSMDFGGWTIRNYLLPQSFLPDSDKVSLIGMTCSPKSGATTEEYEVQVGEIKVFDPSCLRDHTHQVTNISCQDILWVKPESSEGRPESTLSLSLTLKWNYPVRAQHFDVFCSGVTRDPNMSRVITSSEKVFVGRAHTDLFRVCQMVVPKLDVGETKSLLWYIQPTTSAGLSAPFEKMSCCEFWYSE